jgi:hypothetical protein
LHSFSTGRQVVRTIRYRSSLSSAEWIEEDPSGPDGFLPLARTGAVYVRGAQFSVHGRVSNLSGPGIVRLVPSGRYSRLTAFTIERIG